MRVLVSGGAGFIGSHIVRGLLKRGHHVVVADNLSTGRIENLEGVQEKIEFRRLDVAEPELAMRAVRAVEAVIHEAAIASVPRSIDDPVMCNRANVDGTLNLLVAAKREGIKRFVYAASSSAYGDSPVQPKTEDMTPNPLSPYAIGKLTGEYYCSVFHQIFGMETISLRYFNVFGPRQDPRSEYAAVIPKFITMLLAGQTPTIYGDGEQSRDFTFVDNIVEANLLALEADKGFGQTMNIACGESFSLNDLYRKISGFIGSGLEPQYEPARAGDVKHSSADISRAEQLLGYRPTVGFDEGLRQTVDYFRTAGEEASA